MTNERTYDSCRHVSFSRVIIRPLTEKQPTTAVQTPVRVDRSGQVGSRRSGQVGDAAIAGRERSNGEIPPGGMRCFPLRGLLERRIQRGLRVIPYGAIPATLLPGLRQPAIQLPPATRCVRTFLDTVSRSLSPSIVSHAIYKKYFLKSYSE